MANNLPLTRSELARVFGDDQDLIIRFEELFEEAFTGTPGSVAAIYNLLGIMGADIAALESDVLFLESELDLLELVVAGQAQDITTLFNNYNTMLGLHNTLRSDHNQLQTDHNQLQTAHNQLLLRVTALENKFNGNLTGQIDTAVTPLIDVTDGLVTGAT